MVSAADGKDIWLVGGGDLVGQAIRIVYDVARGD